MNLGWTIAGAVLGLLAGAALHGAVVRLSVPVGEPQRTTCPGCAAPLPRLLAFRCVGCGSRLGPFPLLELASGAAVGALAAASPTRRRSRHFAYLASWELPWPPSTCTCSDCPTGSRYRPTGRSWSCWPPPPCSATTPGR